jgi:hypothetical protein
VAEEILDFRQQGKTLTQEVSGQFFYQQTKEVALDDAGVRIPTRMGHSPSLMSMTIQGARDNTGPVYIGDFSVGGNGSANVGFALQPGVEFGPVRCTRAHQVYFNADNDGDRLVIIGVM